MTGWSRGREECFAAPPFIPGAWATGRTVEAARSELREVIEDMILFSAWLGIKMTEVGGVSLAPHATAGRSQRSA